MHTHTHAHTKPLTYNSPSSLDELTSLNDYTWAHVQVDVQHCGFLTLTSATTKQVRAHFNGLKRYEHASTNSYFSK